MAKESYERDFDDEVYEDEYYDEHYEEEELDEDILENDDNDAADDEKEDDDDEYSDDVESWENEKRIHLSFACEDCDYRWEDTVVKKKTGHLEDEEEEEFDAICPMCGSMNITQI